eukprot:7171531-Prorocentrum_lima.AAC.1
MLHPHEDDHLLARFLHPVSFLHCSLIERASWPGARAEAGGFVLRALRRGGDPGAATLATGTGTH